MLQKNIESQEISDWSNFEKSAAKILTKIAIIYLKKLFIIHNGIWK